MLTVRSWSPRITRKDSGETGSRSSTLVTFIVVTYVRNCIGDVNIGIGIGETGSRSSTLVTFIVVTR